MALRNNGTTIDSTVGYMLFGMLVIIFVALTIFGMKRIEATAEQVKQDHQNAKVVDEEIIDINGDAQ
ncbi:hypothetical protein [Thalassoglobus polymorphus]|uniref:Uncharacterized protein n=1 Tax=Thalassoglobus polymorphus TaxID=2527994 RepID=A0A517QTH5_9PLAN|nr:hypothetical protein [Thalassoglobus polymorphus]QDT34944.1 hypothetical protein Mal48_42170 [Thalassoglobus polymorphus]